MRFPHLVIALTLSSTTLMPLTVNASPYDGRYRLNSSWDCRSVGSDGGAIRIQGNSFEGVESSCQMSNPTTVRDMAAHLYDLSCSGEGETYSYRIMIMRADQGDIYLINKGNASLWQKCP